MAKFETNANATMWSLYLVQVTESTRRCTTVRDSEGQTIPCNGGSDGSVWAMGKWSMKWVSG